MKTNKFPWGRVIERFSLDFEATTLEVVKYHPTNLSAGSSHGLIDEDTTLYHVKAIRQSFPSLDEAVIAWITFRRLGLNQGALVTGIARALGLP